jgi:ABC-2 type transport system ATP-binding protein
MGKTILISSHILPELAEMCDEIGVIDNGKLIAHGSVADIQKKLQGEKTITVRLTAKTEEAIAFFEEQPFVASIEKLEDGEGISFVYRGEEAEQVEMLKRAVLTGLPIVSFMEHITNLEDVFMEITKGAD